MVNSSFFLKHMFWCCALKNHKFNMLLNVNELLKKFNAQLGYIPRSLFKRLFNEDVLVFPPSNLDSIHVYSKTMTYPKGWYFVRYTPKTQVKVWYREFATVKENVMDLEDFEAKLGELKPDDFDDIAKSKGLLMYVLYLQSNKYNRVAHGYSEDDINSFLLKDVGFNGFFIKVENVEDMFTVSLIE